MQAELQSLLLQCGMDDDRPDIAPDLEKKTGWGRALLYYTPDLSKPEQGLVIFESAEGMVLDAQTVPADEAYEVWKHPAVSSKPVRTFLGGNEHE